MAGRFVSVSMTLSDLERPDVRNHFFRQIFVCFCFIKNAESPVTSHLIALAQMRLAVRQRELSFLLHFHGRTYIKRESAKSRN